MEPLPLPQVPSGDLPVATHRGILRIAGAELVVYQLSDGQRVIEQASFERFFAP